MEAERAGSNVRHCRRFRESRKTAGVSEACHNIRHLLFVFLNAGIAQFIAPSAAVARTIGVRRSGRRSSGRCRNKRIPCGARAAICRCDAPTSATFGPDSGLCNGRQARVRANRRDARLPPTARARHDDRKGKARRHAHVGAGKYLLRTSSCGETRRRKNNSAAACRGRTPNVRGSWKIEVEAGTAGE